MERQNEIERLDTIYSYIRLYDKRINGRMPEYYKIFGTENRWKHQCEINKKCSYYWKRKFNKILTEINY